MNDGGFTLSGFLRDLPLPLPKERKRRRRVHTHRQAQARRRRQIEAGQLRADNALATLCEEHSLMIAGDCLYCDR